MKVLFLLIIFISLESNAKLKSIFGIDNRRDIVSVHPKIKRMATGMATWMTPTYITLKEKKYSLELETLEEEYGLCSDEKFAKQLVTPISCTAFLIAPDIMFTAGHCMLNVGEVTNGMTPYCKDFKWVFDYQVDGTKNSDPLNRPMESLAECEKIIYAVHNENNPVEDWAIFKLKKSYPGRYNFSFTKNKPVVGEQLAILGYPSGLPLKYAQGAQVLRTKKGVQYFDANIDSFGGNSGSPVFGPNGKVKGILVRGNPDFYTDKKLKCDRWNKCDQDVKNCSEFNQLHGNLYDFGMHIQMPTRKAWDLIQRFQ